MISTGIFPSRLKFLEIQPLFKKIWQIADPSPCFQPSQKFSKWLKCWRLFHNINCNHILVHGYDLFLEITHLQK